MNDIRFLPPSISSLATFEAVARLGSVTVAAKFLNISQTAVSRHLRKLEQHLGAALVVKDGRGIKLTEAGIAYASEISNALSILKEAGKKHIENEQTLTLSCTHEVSHLILLPRYEALKKAVGLGTYLQLLTCEYGMVSTSINAGADIIFEYSKTPPSAEHAMLVAEEITPLASPEFLESKVMETGERMEFRNDVTRIELTKNNTGWATWDSWYASQDEVSPDSPVLKFDNYVYALDAAIRGEGIILGWGGFCDQYLESRQLVPLSSDWLKRKTALYAVITQSGKRQKAAYKFLKYISDNAI